MDKACNNMLREPGGTSPPNRNSESGSDAVTAERNSERVSPPPKTWLQNTLSTWTKLRILRMRVLDNMACIKAKTFSGSMIMQDTLERLFVRLGSSEERLVYTLLNSCHHQSNARHSVSDERLTSADGARTHLLDDEDMSWTDDFLGTVTEPELFVPNFLREAEESINREQIKLAQMYGMDEIGQMIRLNRLRPPRPAVLEYLSATLFENENLTKRDSFLSCLEFLRHRRSTLVEVIRSTEQIIPIQGAMPLETDLLTDEMSLVEKAQCLLEHLFSRRNMYFCTDSVTERDGLHDMQLVSESRTSTSPNVPVVSVDLPLRNAEFEERKTWADFERNNQEILHRNIAFASSAESTTQNCPALPPVIFSNGQAGLLNLNNGAVASKNVVAGHVRSSIQMSNPPLSTPFVGPHIPPQRDVGGDGERQPSGYTRQSCEDLQQPPAYNIPTANYTYSCPPQQPHELLRAQEEHQHAVYEQAQAQQYEAYFQTQQYSAQQQAIPSVHGLRHHHQVQMHQPWPHIHYVPLAFTLPNVEERRHSGQHTLGNGIRLRMAEPSASRNNLNCPTVENPSTTSQRTQVYYEMGSVGSGITGPHARAPRQEQALNGPPNQDQGSAVCDSIRELNCNVQKLIEVASRTEDVLVAQRTYLSWIESGLSTLRQDVRDIREQMTSVDYLANLRLARRMDDAREQQQERNNNSRRNIVDELSRYTEAPETSRRYSDYHESIDRVNINPIHLQCTQSNSRDRSRVVHARVVENFEVPNSRIGDRESGYFESNGGSSMNGNGSMLNNQVPPGTRANNYWDNFKSYSRQNMLSTSKVNIPTNGTSPSGSETRSVSNEESSQNPTASTSRRDSRGERVAASGSKKSSLSANFVENIGLKKRNKDVKLQLSSPSRSTSTSNQPSQNDAVNLQTNHGVLNSFIASSSLEAGASGLDDCQNVFDCEDKVSRPIRTRRMEYYEDPRTPEQGRESSDINVPSTLPDGLNLVNGVSTSSSPSIPSSFDTDLIPVDLSSHQASESRVQRDGQDVLTIRQNGVVLNNQDVRKMMRNEDAMSLSSSQDVRSMARIANSTIANSDPHPDLVFESNGDDTYAGMMLDFMSLEVRDDAIIDAGDDEETNGNCGEAFGN